MSEGLVIGPGGTGGSQVDRDTGRRRASAQQRLRRQANALDALPRPVSRVTLAGFPLADVKLPPEDTGTPMLTADQLRLVADLLDHPTWGQMDG